MIICSKCGKQIPEGSKFCNTCGTTIDVTAKGGGGAVSASGGGTEVYVLDGQVLIKGKYNTSINGGAAQKCNGEICFPVSDVTAVNLVNKGKTRYIVGAVISILAVVALLVFFLLAKFVEKSVDSLGAYPVVTLAMIVAFAAYLLARYKKNKTKTLTIARGSETITVCFKDEYSSTFTDVYNALRDYVYTK